MIIPREGGWGEGGGVLIDESCMISLYSAASKKTILASAAL